MKVHLNYFGQGKPLVFFHGWGFNHQIWLSLVPLLKERYQLILVDLPGFGLTPAMEWPEFKMQLLDILPDKFALVAWSMGGLYATQLSIDAPSRVDCLLNITSSPRFIANSSWPGVSQSLFEQFYEKFSKDSENTLKEFIDLQSPRNKISFPMGVLPSQEGLKLGLTMLKKWDLRGDLKKLTQPVCFMFARRDRITPFTLLNSMQVLYPHFNYVLFEHAAHMPFLSHPELFIKEMVAFIQ